jgi:hypothetical protein
MSELPRLSLCIPTMNRYTDYLSKFLPTFLNYDIFDEVIIVDENGLDKYLLNKNFKAEPKLKVYTNDYRLGAFNNKMKAVSLAKNEWVYLLDSDNFIGDDFIAKLKEFGASKELDPKVIYSPEIAMINGNAHPTGNFSHLVDGAQSDLPPLDKMGVKLRALMDFGKVEFFLNMGNFLVNRSTVMAFDYKPYEEDIKHCKCFDTIFFNYLMTYKNNMRLEIVPGLQFKYAAHEDAYFLPNHTLPDIQKFYRELLDRMSKE